MYLDGNTFFSPFYMFIKDNHQLEDEELLEQLGLTNYQLLQDATESRKCLYITEDNNWKHLMDDWSYTLWHNKDIRNRLRELSQRFDVFYCSIGDYDESFDFVYCQQGMEKRKYVVEDPFYNGGEVTENIGQALKAEEIALEEEEAVDKVLCLAVSLGVNIHHNLETTRCYTEEV